MYLSENTRIIVTHRYFNNISKCVSSKIDINWIYKFKQLSWLDFICGWVYLYFVLNSFYYLCSALGFVYRFAAVDGFGKPGKSAAAAITLTTQGEMCI